jgi:hypothetical protein
VDELVCAGDSDARLGPRPPSSANRSLSPSNAYPAGIADHSGLLPADLFSATTVSKSRSVANSQAASRSVFW